MSIFSILKYTHIFSGRVLARTDRVYSQICTQRSLLAVPVKKTRVSHIIQCKHLNLNTLFQNQENILLGELTHWCWRVTLVMLSEITLGKLRGPYGMSMIKPWLAVYNTNALPLFYCSSPSPNIVKCNNYKLVNFLPSSSMIHSVILPIDCVIEYKEILETILFRSKFVFFNNKSKH